MFINALNVELSRRFMFRRFDRNRDIYRLWSGCQKRRHGPPT